MRVALLGFGLIGGSIARALRAEGGMWHIAAWSPTGNGPRQAAEASIVETAAETADDAIRGADVVILAAPPLACLDLIDILAASLGDALDEAAVVTDVASTKQAIGSRADEAGLRFVGGHPMAGRELGGYESADSNLFVGRPWVLVPGANATRDDVARIERIANACGAQPVEMDAGDHDSAVAAISHLPLVVAAALVEAVTGDRRDGEDAADWNVARRLASTGWEGMTRLARGDVDMGVGILATNGPAVAARLRTLREVIDDWLAAIEGSDQDDVRRRLEDARHRLGEGP
jgi:prephenate dehydrogenase